MSRKKKIAIADATAPKIWTVSELTRQIRGTLEQTFGTVWVEGEISNFKRADSGHCYFTIKDAGAQLTAVMFRGEAADLTFAPSDGLQIVALGDISVYEPRGQYQIICRRLLPKGLGALQAQFEALKKKLNAEGLFDPARKKTIPPFPEHIGIVTSPTGAAIRDILSVINRRYPNVHIVISPVRVQGSGAAEEIASAIDELNTHHAQHTLTLDVLIITRGGGSLEDLWPFNEEIVARAIARSNIPTISAVGHEIDFTIADFVADLRAPTPSAAAELVVKARLELLETVGHLRERLGRGLKHEFAELRRRLEAAAGSYVFREPKNLVARYRQQFDHAREQLAAFTENRLSVERQSVKAFGERLRALKPEMLLAHTVRSLSDLKTRSTRSARFTLQRKRERCDQLAKRLDALSHKATLRRGYSITRTADGKLIKSVKSVKGGDKIRTMVRDGDFGAVVE